MAMTTEAFDQLVERFENQASRDPGGYKLRVFLLAVLGYGYVLAILGVALLLLGFLVWALADNGRFNWGAAKIAIFLVVLVGIILRSLWVRLPEPEGIEIERDQAGPLFADLDELRASLETPRIHKVLLTPEFNASVTQIPRLGVLGWQKNFLSLGLPLMQALSPDELRAVLAHELGHLSRAHGRFGAWIYRVRRTWENLLEQVQKQGHRGAFLFKRFFEWYAPYFGASSFVLARVQEYEADRHAAELAGSRALAQALVRLDVAGSFLGDSYWPALFRRVVSEPKPPEDGLIAIGTTLRQGIPEASATRYLTQALNARTSNHDTHPCLQDRLRALAESPRLPEPPAETAAQRYFGAALERLSHLVTLSWRNHLYEAWQARHQEAREQVQRLAELDGKAEAGTLGVIESFERATLVEALRGEAEALPLYRAVLDRDPGNAGASFALGRLLLEQDDAEGVRWIEAAMERDEDYRLHGSHLIATFWSSRGDQEKAAAFQREMVRQIEILERAEEERSELHWTDTFLAHELPAQAVSHLAQQLAQYPEVEAAYLVRKGVEAMPEKPVYVLAVACGKQLGVFRSRKRETELVQRLSAEVRFSGETFVVSLADAPSHVRGEIRSLPGAEVYRRP